MLLMKLTQNIYYILWLQNIQILRLDGLQSQALKASINEIYLFNRGTKNETTSQIYDSEIWLWVMIVIGCCFQKIQYLPNTTQNYPIVY
jgi:hypothetical protein